MILCGTAELRCTCLQMVGSYVVKMQNEGMASVPLTQGPVMTSTAASYRAVVPKAGAAGEDKHVQVCLVL